MKYLVLSIIAHDVLIVPVSIIASETAFSESRRVVSEKRCILSLEAIICLKYWNLADNRMHDYV